MRSFLQNAVSVIIPLMLFSSCASVPAHVKLPLVDEGEVYLYLQPFPQQADRLMFMLADVTAVKDNGQEFPLLLRLPILRGMDIKRQRLFCVGTLPPGSYIGFSFKVTKATLKSEDEVADLLMPEKPVMVNVPFQVVQRKTAVLFLSFNYPRSVSGGFSFSPVFSIFSPSKPVSAVLGYVSNHASIDLTVFDKQAMQAVGVVATGGRPTAMAFDQKLKRIYAATENDTIEIIDAVTQEALNSIRLNLGDSPRGAALTPDGRLLLTVNAGSNTASMIDTASLLETARIPVGNGSKAVLMDRTGRRAYVFNTFSNTISVIDIANRAIATTLSTDPSPVWGQFNAKGDRLYVIHGQSSYMTVFDPFKLTVLSRVFVGMGMNALKVDPLTDLIYAGRRNDTIVEIYDPLALVAVDFITTGEGAAYLTIDDQDNNLWIISDRSGKVIIVNLVSKKVISEIDVGEEPFRLVLMGER